VFGGELLHHDEDQFIGIFGIAGADAVAAEDSFSRTSSRPPFTEDREARFD
jgi:hypothetical protein